MRRLPSWLGGIRLSPSLSLSLSHLATPLEQGRAGQGSAGHGQEVRVAVGARGRGRTKLSTSKRTTFDNHRAGAKGITICRLLLLLFSFFFLLLYFILFCALKFLANNLPLPTFMRIRNSFLSVLFPSIFLCIFYEHFMRLLFAVLQTR